VRPCSFDAMPAIDSSTTIARTFARRSRQLRKRNGTGGANGIRRRHRTRVSRRNSPSASRRKCSNENLQISNSVLRSNFRYPAGRSWPQGFADDQHKAARLCHKPPEEMNRIWAEVRSFFVPKPAVGTGVGTGVGTCVGTKPQPSQMADGRRQTADSNGDSDARTRCTSLNSAGKSCCTRTSIPMRRLCAGSFMFTAPDTTPVSAPRRSRWASCRLRAAR
jgi:hypothetical protein